MTPRPRVAGPGSAAAVAVVAAVAAVALGSAARPAVGSPAGQGEPIAAAPGGRLYLPRLEQWTADGAFVPVPCAVGADACLPPGWEVRCGGIGRVRDLFVVRGRGDGAGGAGNAAVLAVGDGAAIGVPDGEGIAWRVATGVDLVGLNHVAADADLGAWAVGDGQRIARRAVGSDGCWTIAATGWPTATLLSLEVKQSGGGLDDPWPAGVGGWAVGRATVGVGATAREVGVVAQLDLSARPPTWRNLTRDPDGRLALPPLSDVQGVPGVDGDLAFWALGHEGERGVLAQMRSVRGQWTWRPAVPAVALTGRPSELVLRTERDGWAFGAAPGAAGDAALWRLEGGLWRAAPSRLHPGQPFVDAYVLDFATAVYGLAPADPSGGAEVIRRRVGSGDWEAAARWPAGVAAPMRDGHRALAPLGGDGYLYALGDDLWLVAGASPGAWRRLWQRLDLVAFAGDDRGGWALTAADRAGGADLVRIDQAGVRRWQPPAPLPRLRALADLDGASWAAGDGGATWWRPAGATAWRAVAAEGAVDGDIRALAAARGSGLWAAGVDRAGRGRLWRWRGDGWRPIEAAAAVPLTSIAATGRGSAWATGADEGGGALVFVRPLSAGAGDCPVEPSGERWSRAEDLCVLVTDYRGVAAAATGDDTLWLARERDIVEKGLRGFRVHDDLGRRGPGGDCPVADAATPCRLPAGCRLVSIAAAHPAAVFAAAVCPAPGADADRGMTRLLAWDGGRWREATTVNTPLRQLAAGLDAEGGPWLWAVGAWSTAVRFASP